ncbi:50S ribosomal protein L4 [Candidatus Pacearchaeota archaeon]|nr:50S ribosomal protein L4 [Candidatus Pacearchaeota archaeon]
MKAQLYSNTGEKKSSIDLPSFFSSLIREDIAGKVFEAEKYELMQPYAGYKEAGKRHSASGTISHLRHTWKGHYGKGIARLPRKTMSRRGTQFFWVGAEVSQTRGGRSAHPPLGLHAFRKINSKENTIAFQTGFASTADKEYMAKRYSSLQNTKELPSIPFVIESLPHKTKEFNNLMEKLLGSLTSIAFKKKEVRTGKGKRRGRKYKSTAGLLIIKGRNEKAKFNGVEVKNAQDILMRDIYPLGRLTLYTQQGLKELEEIYA